MRNRRNAFLHDSVELRQINFVFSLCAHLHVTPNPGTTSKIWFRVKIISVFARYPHDS
jgi:hypothetical protein